MDFGWPDELQNFRAELLDFIADQRTPALLKELANVEAEESGGSGPEAIRFRGALNERGYTTMAWPKEYGG